MGYVVEERITEQDNTKQNYRAMQCKTKLQDNVVQNRISGQGSTEDNCRAR